MTPTTPQTSTPTPAVWTAWIRRQPGAWHPVCDGASWSEATDKMDSLLSRQAGTHTETIVLASGEHPDDKRRQLAEARRRRATDAKGSR